MNTRRSAVRLAALLAAALLLAPTPPLPAQDVATEADLFRPLTPEEHERYTKYRQHQELQREAASQTMEAYTDMLQRNMPYLLGNVVTSALERIYLAGSNRQAIPQIPRLRTAVNSYGATYDVPYGDYNGNGLIGIEHLVRPLDGGGEEDLSLLIKRGVRGRQKWNHGWSFEPGAMLQETYVVIQGHTTSLPGGGSVADCAAVTRFAYYSASAHYSFQKRGLEQVCNYRLTLGTADQCQGAAAAHCDASRPTDFWSTAGHVALDVSNRDAPVLRFPDGRTETMGAAGPYYGMFEEDLFPTGGVSTTRALTFTQSRADRNGNLTRFEYPSANLTKVIDPRGRETRYERPSGYTVAAIHAPGFAGEDLVWRMTWTPFTWRPADTFPEVVCLSGRESGPCEGPITFATLTRLSLPDGRAYVFTYEPWGALKTVTEPNGAVTEFQYGDAGTPAFPAFRLGRRPDFVDSLDRRRLVATIVRPEGPSGPAYTTTIEHERVDEYPSVLGNCFEAQWVKETRPDGSIMRKVLCGRGSAASGQALALEQWEGTVLKEGHYYGNVGQPGGSGPLGAMYAEVERGEDPGVIYLPDTSGDFLDLRPTRVDHFREGLRWIERRSYETSDIPATPECTGCLTFRTWGNVTRTSLERLDGQPLVETGTSYFRPAEYIARNLIALPDTVTVTDPQRGVLSQTSFRYDELPLEASGAANLVDVGPARGNVTGVVAEKLTEPGSVITRTQYYDTGDMFKAIDASGNPTTHNPDFRRCTDSATLDQSLANALGHRTRSLSDCFTGATLSVQDPNLQTTQTSYDRLGRPLTVKLPEDPTPTQTFEYYLLGSTDNTNGEAVTSLDRQRTVVRTKDGSSGGHYTKAFTDGLGRTVETHTKGVSESGALGEIVGATAYDNMGRVGRSWLPYFAGPSDTRQGGAGPMVTTTYDALGRVTSTTAPGNLTTTTEYSSAGDAWLTTVTAPAGNQSRVSTDLLGHPLKRERYWAEAPGGARWLATTFQYDAAGRLLEETDPGGSTAFFTYDGLGRMLTMNDPDLGGGVNCWPDLDGDGFGAGTPIFGSGCQAGYVPNGDDCDDGNANARPGQTQCFTTPRENSSYDYDCSGSATVCNPTSYSTSCGGNCSSGCTRFGATVTSSQCGQSVPTGCALSGCPQASCTVGSYTPVSCR